MGALEINPKLSVFLIISGMMSWKVTLPICYGAGARAIDGYDEYRMQAVCYVLMEITLRAWRN